MSVLDESEKSIRDKVARWAKSKGWEVIPIDFGGWPDRLYIHSPNVHVWIEFKRPGGKLSVRQKHRLGTLLGMGIDAHMVDNVQEGKQILERALESAPVPRTGNETHATAGSSGGTS